MAYNYLRQISQVIASERNDSESDNCFKNTVIEIERQTA